MNKIFSWVTHPFSLLAYVLLAIVLLYLPTNGFLRNQYDDAYITYRYAVNLAEGKGLVFNMHEKADAASSFSYTLLLAGFYKLGASNLELVAAFIGIASAIGISWIVYRSILALTKNFGTSYFFGFLIGIHGFISGWSISGMETVFFTFLVTYFIYLYYIAKTHTPVLQTILLTLILLTRMEGILLVGVWFLSEGYKLVVIREKRMLPQFFIQCMLFGVTTLGLYLFKHFYYGSFVSNAVLFKQIAMYYQPNPRHLLMAWGGTSLIVFFLYIFSLLKIEFKRFWSLHLYVAISMVTLLFGPHSDGGRYSVHLLPIIIIFSGVVLSQMLQVKKKRKVAILLIGLILIQTLLSTFVVRMYMMQLTQGQACRQELGRYLSHTLLPGEYVFAGDLGMIAYTAKTQEFIDMSGLTSKDVLSFYQRKEKLDKLILTLKPKVLVDSFFIDKKGNLVHYVLTNKVEHIKGMKTYTTLFPPESFQKRLSECKDNERAYSVIDISNLY